MTKLSELAALAKLESRTRKAAISPLAVTVGAPLIYLPTMELFTIHRNCGCRGIPPYHQPKHILLHLSDYALPN